MERPEDDAALAEGFARLREMHLQLFAAHMGLEVRGPWREAAAAVHPPTPPPPPPGPWRR
jgi:hypothetical protein